MSGQYSEKLKSGGEIVVSASSWHIKYYFSGPDLRYNGTFDTTGAMGMSVRIGWAEGVCLRSYHMPVNSRRKLDEIISDYKYAKKRATQLQTLLQNLN